MAATSKLFSGLRILFYFKSEEQNGSLPVEKLFLPLLLLFFQAIYCYQIFLCLSLFGTDACDDWWDTVLNASRLSFHLEVRFPSLITFHICFLIQC